MKDHNSNISEPERRGWVYLEDGVWWYGNGNIVPYNWTKMFDESVKEAGQKIGQRKTKQQGQLTLFP